MGILAWSCPGYRRSSRAIRSRQPPGMLAGLRGLIEGLSRSLLIRAAAFGASLPSAAGSTACGPWRTSMSSGALKTRRHEYRSALLGQSVGDRSVWLHARAPHRLTAQGPPPECARTGAAGGPAVVAKTAYEQQCGRLHGKVIAPVSTVGFDRVLRNTITDRLRRRLAIMRARARAVPHTDRISPSPAWRYLATRWFSAVLI